MCRDVQLAWQRWSGSRRFALKLQLHGDRRAIHLETALADDAGTSVWFPRGLDKASLRVAYQEIIEELIHQFHLEYDGRSEEQPAVTFGQLLNQYRFALNVLAEAILSRWTETPLPACASAQRTDLIVRAIGWGESHPAKVGHGQVLFRAQVRRTLDRPRHGTAFSLAHRGNVAGFTTRDDYAYFALSEARQLNVGVDDCLRRLADLTRKGQFHMFDGRRGYLSPNVALPAAFGLNDDRASSPEMLLPTWAYAKPQPAALQPSQDYAFFTPLSEEQQLRTRARRRLALRISRSRMYFESPM